MCSGRRKETTETMEDRNTVDENLEREGKSFGKAEKYVKDGDHDENRMTQKVKKGEEKIDEVETETEALKAL